MTTPVVFPITAAGQSAAIEVGYAASVIAHLRGGTVNAAGVNGVFEGSLDSTDGVDGTWFAIVVGRVGTNAPSTLLSGSAFTLAANASFAAAWRVNVAGLAWLRVRVTTLTAGNIRVAFGASTEGTDPVPVLTPVANPSPTGVAVLDPSVAGTNLAALRTSSADLYEITVSNPTATAAFVKLYDKATAPVLANDTPILTIPVAAGAVAQMAFGFLGKRFATGLAIAITGAAPATDTTAAPAGVIVHLTRGE